jgi:hypothetical protein
LQKRLRARQIRSNIRTLDRIAREFEPEDGVENARGESGPRLFDVTATLSNSTSRLFFNAIWIASLRVTVVKFELGKSISTVDSPARTVADRNNRQAAAARAKGDIG